MLKTILIFFVILLICDFIVSAVNSLIIGGKIKVKIKRRDYKSLQWILCIVGAALYVVLAMAVFNIYGLALVYIGGVIVAGLLLYAFYELGEAFGTYIGDKVKSFSRR